MIIPPLCADIISWDFTNECPRVWSLGIRLYFLIFLNFDQVISYPKWLKLAPILPSKNERMQQCPTSDQTNAYNVLEHAKYLLIAASRSHIKHGLNKKLSVQVRNACNSQNINQCNICRSHPAGYTQTPIISNHKWIIINAWNSINAHQQNKPVENWDRVNYCQLNKRQKKGTIKKSF